MMTNKRHIIHMSAIPIERGWNLDIDNKNPTTTAIIDGKEIQVEFIDGHNGEYLVQELESRA